VPVWITENNVTQTTPSAVVQQLQLPSEVRNGYARQQSFLCRMAFPVFEQLGERARKPYTTGFRSDQQYGEIGSPSGGPPYTTQLSYWVDYYLSHWFPSPPGQVILQTTTTGCCVPSLANGWEGSPFSFDTQTMAARNPDGSVVVLMSNYSLSKSNDDNGPGLSRTFALDLSALGTFASATLVTLDASRRCRRARAAIADSRRADAGHAAGLRRGPVAPVQRPAHSARGRRGQCCKLRFWRRGPGEIVSLYGTALGPAAGANLELTNPVLVSNALAGCMSCLTACPPPSPTPRVDK